MKLETHLKIGTAENNLVKREYEKVMKKKADDIKIRSTTFDINGYRYEVPNWGK